MRLINRRPGRSWRVSLAILPFALLLIAYLAGSATRL
ncbi:MAG: lipid kinase, partial [Azoarcus sp.]